MQGALLLNIVIRERPSVLKLLASKDQSLLVGRDTFLVLNLGLDVVNGVGRLNFESDRLAGQSLHEDLHTTAETEDKMKGRFLLNVIVRKGSAIF